MDKPAPVDHPVHELIARRWSPRALDARPLAPGQLRSLLEAARWAPSCFNEQPWAFLVARREDDAQFARMLSCLVEANQEWARNASVLLLTVARSTFARNGKPNPHARHDVGLAVAQLAMQATALGLVVHQMAGVRAAESATEYGVPADHEVVTAVAIGHPGDPATLDETRREAELAPRARKPQDEMVFEGAWGRPMDG